MSLSLLPDELLAIVATNLNFDSLLRLQLLSKSFHKVISRLLYHTLHDNAYIYHSKEILDHSLKTNGQFVQNLASTDLERVKKFIEFKYLKKLDTLSLKNVKGLRLLEFTFTRPNIKTIRSLRFCFKEVVSFELEVFKMLTNVKELRLDGLDHLDETMMVTILSEYFVGKLKALGLNEFSHLNAALLSCITQYQPQLQVLDLVTKQYTPADEPLVLILPYLTKLNLSCNQKKYYLFDYQIQNYKFELPLIKKLFLSGPPFRACQKDLLFKSSNLKKIHLERVRLMSFQGQFPKSDYSLNQLRNLHLSFCLIYDQDLLKDIIVNLPQLDAIKLERCIFGHVDKNGNACYHASPTLPNLAALFPSLSISNGSQPSNLKSLSILQNVRFDVSFLSTLSQIAPSLSQLSIIHTDYYLENPQLDWNQFEFTSLKTLVIPDNLLPLDLVEMIIKSSDILENVVASTGFIFAHSEYFQKLKPKLTFFDKTFINQFFNSDN